jgi:hypothetical protein
MLTRNLRLLLQGSLLKPRRFISHIKDMNEENARVIAEKMSQEPLVLPTDRIYKPTYTIEFNREGEVLIYSGNPIRDSTVYFKYPYIFCTPCPTQMRASCPWPSSTTCSTRSTSSGTGTASSSTSPPSSTAPGYGTGATLPTTPTASTSLEEAGSSELRHRPSEMPGRSPIR